MQFQKKEKRQTSDAPGILTVGIGRCGAVCCKRHIGMMKDIILEIPDGALSAYKKKCVPVVQHTHFVRCHRDHPKVCVNLPCGVE